MKVLALGIDARLFCLGVSATQTSGGRMMWQKVKDQTENELIALHWLYQMLRPLFVLARPFRSLYIHGEDLGRAMLYSA